MFRRASIGLATTVCMLMLAALSAYAIPAIDLDGRGVTVVRTADATSLDIRVKVIDFNSKEHTVTVTAPFGVDIPLQFESSQDDSYYYSGVYDLEGEDEIGNYVISAKNDSGESATAVDSIEKYKIEIPDSSSFSPSLVADSISANFSLIYINYVYQRYDTFTDNPWEFGDRWEAWSCMPVLFPSKRSASLVAADSLGKTRNPRAVRPLLGLLSDKSPLLRALASRSLGSLGDKRAVKRLKLVVEMEKNAKVLKEARRALELLGEGSSDMSLDIDGMMKGMDLDMPAAPGP